MHTKIYTRVHLRRHKTIEKKMYQTQGACDFFHHIDAIISQKLPQRKIEKEKKVQKRCVLYNATLSTHKYTKETRNLFFVSNINKVLYVMILILWYTL